MRAAIYARVSKSDGIQDTTNQLTQLRAYCRRMHWTIAHEYIDHASGKSGDRTQFTQMLADASRTKFDCVLVWALDRMTREGIAETFNYIKRLLAHNVQFVSYTEEHFRTTGPTGELMIAVAAWIAKQERLRISERTKAGLARVRAAGGQLGRRKRIFDRSGMERMRAVGKSMAEIARETKLSRSTVYRILGKGYADVCKRQQE